MHFWFKEIMLCTMKRIHLSNEEKSDLEVRHSSCSNGKERDRIKAVLLRSEGWTIPLIAQVLRLHESTVIRHLDDYRVGKLTLASGGSESHLTEEQSQELITHLDEHMYDYVHDIIGYVESKWSPTQSQ